MRFPLLLVVALAAALVGCEPSGDPHNPNPGDFQAALPCVPNPLADKTVAVEIIDREGRLVGAPGLLISRDAVSIQGSSGRGGYAIDVPEGRSLPWDSSERAPYCWDLFLLPGVTEAIVIISGAYPLLSGERLACFEFEVGTNIPNMRNYVEVLADSVVSLEKRCRLEVVVTPA